jgi:hypothetical protein
MGKLKAVAELFEGRHFDREVIILCVRVRFAPDSPLEGTGFEPSVPRDTTNLSMSPLVGSPPTEKSERKENRHTKLGHFPRGTDGSNPVPSSGESANHRFLSGGAKSATTRALGLRAQRFFDWLDDELRVGARGRLSR